MGVPNGPMGGLRGRPRGSRAQIEGPKGPKGPPPTIPWKRTYFEPGGLRPRLRGSHRLFLGNGYIWNMWQHVATCGDMWQRVAACGDLWQFVVRGETLGARLGENPWSKISVEIPGLRLRWNCWEQDFGGNPWSKTSGETPWSKTLVGNPWSRTWGGNRWSKTWGRSPMEQDFGGGHSWSKTSGETLGARLWGKPLEQDFGGNPRSKTWGGKPLEQDFGGNPCSKTSGENP